MSATRSVAARPLGVAGGFGALLFVLWIGMIGADRIDLLAGAGPFVLKPMLILTGPLLLVEMLRLVRGTAALRIPPNTPWFFLFLSAFIAALLVSIIANIESEYATRRFALLATEAYASFIVVILLAARADAQEILVRGAVLGMLLILVFDAVQLAQWFGFEPGNWMRLGGTVALEPTTYGPLLPRPSGVSIDPNRGGLVILFYVYVLAVWGRPSTARSFLFGLGGFALLLTLSRSAILAGIVTAGVAIIRRGVRASPTTIAYTAAIAAPVTVLLLASTDVQDAAVALGDVLAGRFSFDEGSASEHLALLERGWDISARSPKNLVAGIGFGNSYTVLQDFFPGLKYGNFHSLYFTVLVEGGVIAFLLMMVLLAYGAVRSNWLQAYVAGIAAFNLFYQSHTEALFWFVLAVAWIGIDGLGDVRGTTYEVRDTRQRYEEGRNGMIRGVSG